VAVHLYAGDNQDHFPYSNWGHQAGHPGINNDPGWLYKPSNNNPPTEGAPPTANFALMYPNGELWQYLKNINVYWCPVDASRTNTAASSYSNPSPGRDNKLSTYLMSGCASDFSYEKDPTFKLSDIRIDGVLMWEPPDTVISYNDGAEQPNGQDGPGVLHNGGAVELYIDGHTLFMLRPLCLSLMQSTVPNEFWWDPLGANGGHDRFF
jgi:hypothetical protein